MRGTGDTTGYTLNGTSSSDLQIFDTSVMHLQIGSGIAAGWLFRWKDGTGDWIATLDGLLASGRITVDGATGYTVTDSGGYTYIGFAANPVPEPSTLTLMFSAVTISTLYLRSRRRGVTPQA